MQLLQRRTEYTDGRLEYDYAVVTMNGDAFSIVKFTDAKAATALRSPAIQAWARAVTVLNNGLMPTDKGSRVLSKQLQVVNYKGSHRRSQ